ncbi:Probable nucleoredoxin 1 [Seminavis robusta]|uniref:protein-disulfide reductase n=1 Tax=Seminavis robusta TaxID=568900 RepID=A0A9N8HVA8_9STRA|nr:Probable nucleoredoxin 1 [Seminavis robusta]|eukprot:Sro1484_g276430.1 Probable nucleoredoxin 1 (784) ;mRNA; f:1513-3977
MSNASSSTSPFSLTDLLGPKAVSADGNVIDIGSEWAGKKATIALYFSAHWCPPCRAFTPKLAKAHQEYKDSGNIDESFELVFVSSDSDEEAFKEYHGEMTFPALNYLETQKVKEGLDERYKVQGIPALVIIDAKTGERLDNFAEDDDDNEEEEEKKSSVEKKWLMSPREMVSGYGSLAFPLSEASSKRCKDSADAKQQKALAELLTLPNAILPPKEGSKPAAGDTFSFGQLLSDYDYVGLLLGCNAGLSDLPSQVKTLNEVNAGGAGNKLAVVYVPECFLPPWADKDDEAPVENSHQLFHFQDKPSTDIISLLVGMTGKDLMYDSLVVVQQTMLKVDECGLDGVCTSRSVPKVEMVSVDEYMQNCGQHGAKFFPWTTELVDQAKAAEKARADDVKSKMEESLESFLLKHVQIGDSKAEEAVVTRLRELDDTDGVIALLFSPDESLASDLATCFEQLNQPGQKTKMEVVFVAPEWKTEELNKAYAKMITTNSKTQFMAIDLTNDELRRSVRNAMEPKYGHAVFLMKKDGAHIQVEGGAQNAIEESSYYGFPWNKESIATGKEKMADMFKERDAQYEQLQKDMGLPVIRRLLGSPRGTEQKPAERTVKIPGWMTFGMPETLISVDTPSNYPSCTENGVFYYEIELLELGDYACSQIGFSAPGGLDAADMKRSDGCGDTKETWGVCGIRQEVWNDGDRKSVDFGAKLKKGDVIGLAVNTKLGKIAFSINGSATMIVFQDDIISSKGVFPCISIGESELLLSTSSDKFKHSGPSSEDWSKEVEQPEA